MNNSRKFRAHCADCGALLRSQKRLRNHQMSRCNARIWKRKPATYVEQRGCTDKESPGGG